METSFLEFAKLCRSLEETSSTLEKRRIISNFLRKINPDEWKPFVLLLTGKVLPESENKALYVGYSTIKKAISSKIQTLIPLGPPTIKEVYRELNRVASISGADVQRKRVDILSSLLSRMSDIEREFLIRSLSGEMRIGAEVGLVLQALADAAKVDIEKLRKAYLLIGDIGELAEKLSKKELNLDNIKPKLFNPIRPMLATSADTIEEAMQLAGGRAAVEVKYDGVRVQIHYASGEVKVFSRRLTDVTENLPEVTDVIKKTLKVRDVI